jgi:hypothetical protein
MMASVEECRRQALECTRQSEEATEPKLRTVTSSMAKSWTVLANQMERLRSIDAEMAKRLELGR